MEFKEGLQTIREMCKQAPLTCVGCLLDRKCPFGFPPHEWSDNDTEHIVAAAEEWKEKHKPKTMMAVLKERLPNVRLNDAGRPDACPSFFFGGETQNLCDFGSVVNCEDCWNRPAPERYQTKDGEE